MLIQIASDIHLEQYYGKMPQVGRIINKIPVLADTMMLAGDIMNLRNKDAVEYIFNKFCKRWKTVFFVFGNHEFYNSEVYYCLFVLDEIAKKFSNLHVLRTGTIVEHEGHRFLGDAMWFKDHPSNVHYKKFMNDFHVIQNYEPWVYEQNTAFLDFLDKNLQKGDIVMTHHLPTDLSINPKFKGDSLNRFFVTECFDLIADRKIALWAHGHGHDPEDQYVESTRIVVNPMGYKGQENKGFMKGKVVEI